MRKIFILLITITIPFCSNAQTKSKIKSSKKTSQKLTPGELELIKFRQENPVYFKNHIEGLADSTGRTSIDYSNFNGKNCTEIAKKENWGNWNPPLDADKRCEKYLKMKKVKKVLFYPLIK